MTTDVIEVTTSAELDSVLADNDRVVVDFAAESWCVPCQRLAPHYEAAAAQVKDVAFVHVDIEQAPDLATRFEIMGVPTLLSFKDGQQTGTVSARTALALINEVSSI